jgi:frataxin-like iron-binding protein CyaY
MSYRLALPNELNKTNLTLLTPPPQKNLTLREHVLRSTWLSSTIGIEEKKFDEYEKLWCSTRI